MHASARVNELEARYVAVFQGLRENRHVVGDMSSPLALIHGPRRLKRCLQRLDDYAEHLQGLDRDLGRIAELRDTDRQEYIDSLSRYSELLELGTRVYSTLYREYKEIRKLRETLDYLLLSAAAFSVAAAGLLILLF